MKMCDCVNGGQCKRKEVCVGLCELDNLMMCMHLTNCCLVCVRKRCKMGNTTSHNHENVGLVFFLFVYQSFALYASEDKEREENKFFCLLFFRLSFCLNIVCLNFEILDVVLLKTSPE